MEHSKEIMEMLTMISALIATIFLIIKFLNKTTKPKSKITLNLSSIPTKKLSSKQVLMNRLIDYEIKRMPHLSRKDAERIALDRLARDNR